MSWQVYAKKHNKNRDIARTQKRINLMEITVKGIEPRNETNEMGIKKNIQEENDTYKRQTFC